MTLSLWLQKITNRHLRLEPERTPYLLCSKKFYRIACTERARADRSGRELSCLLIQLPHDARRSKDVSYLGSLLRDRLRLTDFAGLLPDGRVGVLLPDTSESGAWKVASDVLEVYPSGTLRPDCEVVVYPDNRDPTRMGDNSDAEIASTESGQPGNRFDLFLATYSDIDTWKRRIDVVGGSIGLLCSSPIVALAAVAIKLTSPGPIFYRQEREGLAGKRFSMVKLRSMSVNADDQKSALRVFSEQDGPAFKMKNDPRITTVGRFLRKFSLDELPQFWNVLRGDMSLVGPRPLPTSESIRCQGWQRRRLLVRPGMTCVWQVFGRNLIPFEKWMRMDLSYVNRKSLLLDILLLCGTLPSLLFSRGPR